MEQAAKGPPRREEKEEDTHTPKLIAMTGTAVRETTSIRETREIGVQVSMTPRRQSAPVLNQKHDDTWRPQEFGEYDDELAAPDGESLFGRVAIADQVLEL